MVNLREAPVGTLFGELEYLEPRLKALGIVEVDDAMRFAVDEAPNNV